MVKIAVLVSGGGTNLQALIDRRGYFPDGELSLVLSSSGDAYALERARTAGIETLVLEPGAFADRESFTRAVTDALLARGIGLVVLAGFMFILSPCFFDAFGGRVVNVHPALIPAFCGKGFYGLRVHRAVLDYGVKLTGATVHFVDSVVDGGPIILQKAIEVLPDDSPESLQKRVMEQCEWELLPRAVGLFCAGRLRISGRVVYCGAEDSVI